MRVYNALAKAFADEGTTSVFGMMGSGNQYWIDAIAKLGISVFEVRHEGAGLAMADGWARVAGSPAVCTTTYGPGTTQLATTMVVASRAKTPLVVFCGDTPWGDDGADAHFDQARFATACEAAFIRVTTPDSTYEAVRSAFYQAKLESRPVMLSVPVDIQQLPFDDGQEYVPSSELFERVPLYPHPDRVAIATDLVAQCERPVIVVGRGAQASGAGVAVARLAERIGAVVVTTFLAMNWLRDATEYHAGISGLFSTKATMELFQDADCVIGVGATLNRYTIANGYLFPSAKYLQFDSKPHIVMGNGRSADCYVQSDARLGIEALDAALEQRSVRMIGYRTPEVKALLGTALDDPTEYVIEPGVLDPREVCLALDAAIPQDVGLVVSNGHQAYFGAMLFTRPRSLSLPNGFHFSCIGQGVTTAIGAVMATGNKPACVVEGDAGFMMHLAEFETAVRYNVPLLAVVLNDEALGAEYQKGKALGIDPALARISTPDLGKVAIALGGRGELVRTIDLLRTSVAEFLEHPEPTLLDVRISRNVISIPYRRSLYGQEDI